MNEIEKLFEKEKAELDALKVPDELEARLNKALEDKNHVKHRKGSWKLKVAMMAMVFILVSYNIDTLAYYGRELLGFEGVMNGTLNELNKMGMGQTIDKEYTFSNGIKVTLNGIMIDDNQLLMFYTLEKPEGVIDELNFHSRYVEGAFGVHRPGSAQGLISEDGAMIRWVEKLEPPYAFEKKLTWSFSTSTDGKAEEGKISFELDRSKAMGHSLKVKLNKAIKVDGVDISFDTITASPTATVIRGTIQNPLELAMAKISGERIYSPRLNVQLLANGEVIENQGGGMGTDKKGMKFELRYDALPKDLTKLQLHLVSFGAEHEVNELIALEKTSSPKTLQIQGQDITIEKVQEFNGETLVTITTAEDVILRKVHMLAGDSRVELTETIDESFDKLADGKITKTRTLRFKTAGNKLQLEVKGITYTSTYDEYLEIPVK